MRSVGPAAAYRERLRELDAALDRDQSASTMATARLVNCSNTKHGQQRHFVDRLQLDGVREYVQSTSKLEKLIWFSITLVSYIAAIYLSFLTWQRFYIARKVVSRESDPPQEYIEFPFGITVCHTVYWNKTYMEETIRIPDHILTKAASLGLHSKALVLSKFSKYLSYYNYNFFDDEQSISPDILELMSELYEDIFKNIQLSDIVQDAVIRSSMMERCTYKNEQYRCDRAMPMSVDSPSCHVIPINYRNRLNFERDSFERAEVKFDVVLPIEHIFHDDAEVAQDLGLKLLLSTDPTPFHPLFATPANTHAIVVYTMRSQVLKTNCTGHEEQLNDRSVDPNFFWMKTYETCLLKMFETVSRNSCRCHFIAGNYYPNNSAVCTPKMIKECVQTRAMQMLYEDSEKYNELKRACPRPCWTDDFIPSVTYYDLENATCDRIRNVITIRPDLDQWIVATERDLTNIYGAFSEVGAVIGVYTGLSIAMILRLLALFGGRGLKFWNHRVIKPMLARRLPETPLSIRWDLSSILHYRRVSIAVFALRYCEDDL